MKCYLQNTNGTIRRVDKLKPIKEKLPKDSDYSRRIFLCSQNKLPWTPFVLEMTKQEFRDFQILVDDIKPRTEVKEYRVFDNNQICILRVINNGK